MLPHKVETIYNTLWQIYSGQISPEFYHNRPGFVDDVTKRLVCFGFVVLIAVHLQNANAKFHKVT